MEELTRHNYEIWFLDYLDGQLSDTQLEVLLDFLEVNPDLKAELLGVSGVSLTAGHDSLNQKEQLLKTEADIPGIGTLDQLCIARMENDLSTKEAAQFDQRMAEDMELRANYHAFLHSRLNSSNKVVYPYKNELKRKTVIFTPWLITAISSAAVLLLIWFLWPNPTEKTTPVLAKIEKPVTIIPQPTTDNRQPITDNRQLINNNRQPTTDNRQPTTLAHGEIKLAQVESPIRETSSMTPLIGKSSMAGPRIPDPQRTRLLYASNIHPVVSATVDAEGALTIPQYALQLFREKILGQDRRQVKSTRFSMWEVAGAGVEKINSLAGTQMKLNREYDSKGEILAVSFNSRLLDVEAPVKGQ